MLDRKVFFREKRKRQRARGKMLGEKNWELDLSNLGKKETGVLFC